MITAAYCQTMAQYNAWQNQQISDAIANLDQAALDADRGVFFGSLLSTLNHLLWGDKMWMARFTGAPLPAGSIADGTALTTSGPEWVEARRSMDDEIVRWATSLTEADLGGDLVWYSGAVGREVSRPRSLCVLHMFNHQTHHRGQVHAMLTGIAVPAPVSDLAFMPKAGP